MQEVGLVQAVEFPEGLAVEARRTSRELQTLEVAVEAIALVTAALALSLFATQARLLMRQA
jgi:hypothetical protein